MDAKELKCGDIIKIVEIGYSVNKEYRAILLWKGLNNQPLILKFDDLLHSIYEPKWSDYRYVTEVTDHIDLKGMLVTKLLKANVINKRNLAKDKFATIVPKKEKKIRDMEEKTFWLRKNDENGNPYIECSKCGRHMPFYDHAKFCPDCGKEMAN